MSSKDSKIRRQMERAGWSQRIGTGRNKHEKWCCGCGEHGPIIRARSVGGGRGSRNFQAMMKRQGRCSVDIKLG